MRFGSIIGVIVVVIVGVLVQQFLFKSPSFDKQLMNAASELNETCPIMVDQETRLDNAVSLPGKVFQYNYTLVNFERDSIDINLFEEHMQPLILNNVKTNPDLEDFRKNKVTMAYNYNDKNGNFVLKISIEPKQYEN